MEGMTETGKHQPFSINPAHVGEHLMRNGSFTGLHGLSHRALQWGRTADTTGTQWSQCMSPGWDERTLQAASRRDALCTTSAPCVLAQYTEGTIRETQTEGRPRKCQGQARKDGGKGPPLGTGDVTGGATKCNV